MGAGFWTLVFGIWGGSASTAVTPVPAALTLSRDHTYTLTISHDCTYTLTISHEKI